MSMGVSEMGENKLKNLFQFKATFSMCSMAKLSANPISSICEK